MEELNSVFVIPGYTFFYYGFSVPKKIGAEYADHFGLGRKKLNAEIVLIIGNRKYPAKIRVARQVSPKYPQRHVTQIYYDSQSSTLKALRKQFIYSYASTINNSKPKLKELAEFVHEGKNIFRVKSISRQETDFDMMFKEMEDRHLFEYWKGMKRGETPTFFVETSPHWLGVDDLSKVGSRANVIYVLYNSRTHQIYVGKANVLGDRVKKGHGRIGLENDWDKFLYFVIDPQYNPFIEQIENFVIRTYAAVMENTLRVKPIADRRIKLVNRRLNGE